MHGAVYFALTHINPGHPPLVQSARVIDPIAAIAGFCAHAGALAHTSQGAGLLLGMAMLGLTGSAAHCAPMCGPLVLGQGLHRLSCLSCSQMREHHRLRAGLLARYHLGRVLAYSALGAIAGLAGFTLEARLAPFRSLVLLLAALSMGWAAWRARAPIQRGSVSRTLAPPGSLRFGLAMGLLPCGLLYTALLAACASASPWRGAAAMAAFGAATVPMLAGIGLAGTTTPMAAGLRKAAPILLGLNACILTVAALAHILV